MAFKGDRVAFSFAEPAGETLRLARPLPHPWFRNREISRVGLVPELPEGQGLADANAQVARVGEGTGSPRLAARTVERLERALDEYCRALLTPTEVVMPDPVYRAAGPYWGRSGDYKANGTGRVRLICQNTFSGKSVIAPALEPHHDRVGLPDEMAWALFGPLVERSLGDRAAVRERNNQAERELDAIMADSWVIVNHAPSMTPTAELAFRPIRVPGQAIRFNVLASVLMNADFDGDQVAVFLPLTTAAQQEAGDRLSLAGHLKRDPGLITLIYPPMESLWGLAYLSLSDEGNETITSVAGIALRGPDGYVTRQRLGEGMARIMAAAGEEHALDVIDRLMALGFDTAKRSGASLNPFAADHLPPLKTPEPFEIQACFDQDDELRDAILSRTDFDAEDIGPQLLAVKSGARGSENHLKSMLRGGAIVTLDDGLLMAPTGFLVGHSAEACFTWCVGAQSGLASNHTEMARMGVERRNACQPKGYSVLARALRSRSAGAVFARAAANGEVDPLRDPDARLLTGLLPLID